MLAHYAGQGAARLLRHDRQRTAMLIAHVAPGHRLLDAVHDDDTATRIVADLIVRSTSPISPGLTIPTIVDWAEPLGRIARQFPAFTLITPTQIALAQHIFATDTYHGPWSALHGDLHHENILAGANEWVIIDPQGIQAPQAYETTAFLRNHHQHLAHHNDIVGLTRRRIEIFAATLGVTPVSIARLNVAAMVLAAWWCYEDEHHINAYELQLVEAMQQVLHSYEND
jgi:streptomycin 6-kinase